MTFNWKRSLIIVFDIVISAYLILAVTAFNKPAERAKVCTEVKIDIDAEKDDDITTGDTDGFLNANEIKRVLESTKMYPLGKSMENIDARTIEETLRKNPFVEGAECYKTQSGHVCIRLQQRTPVAHVMLDNSENYYVDTNGNILPASRFATDIVIATGAITKKYAQKSLVKVANEIIHDPFWQNQIEQINILSDGSVELVPRVGDHIIYLGAPVNTKKKLERMRKFYLYGLNKAGWNKYSYISVEFDNQIICKKSKKVKK